MGGSSLQLKGTKSWLRLALPRLITIAVAVVGVWGSNVRLTSLINSLHESVSFIPLTVTVGPLGKFTDRVIPVSREGRGNWVASTFHFCESLIRSESTNVFNSSSGDGSGTAGRGIGVVNVCWIVVGLERGELYTLDVDVAVLMFTMNVGEAHVVVPMPWIGKNRREEGAVDVLHPGSDDFRTSTDVDGRKLSPDETRIGFA